MRFFHILSHWVMVYYNFGGTADRVNYDCECLLLGQLED